MKKSGLWISIRWPFGRIGNHLARDQFFDNDFSA